MFYCHLAKPEQFETLVQLINTAYIPELQFKHVDRTSLVELEQIAQNPEQHIYVVTQQDTIVGCIVVTWLKTSLYFGMFAVWPHLQHGGIGRFVLTELESIALQHHKIALECDVANFNPHLVLYYQKRGFYHIDTIPWISHELKAGQASFLRFYKPLTQSSEHPKSPSLLA